MDRYPRKWIMFGSDVVRAALTLSFFYIWFQIHSLTAVFIVVFFMGALNGLFIPARQAALPQIVSAGQLITANSLISLVGVIANFVGVPIVQSHQSPIFGAKCSFLFNSLGFLASAWCIYHIRNDMAPDHTKAEESDKVGTWSGALAGWRVLREKRELGALSSWSIPPSRSSARWSTLSPILQQVVVKVDLDAVRALAESLVHFFSMFAPKPPVFGEIKTLAFGLLMAGIGLGLGVGVGTLRAASKAA